MHSHGFKVFAFCASLIWVASLTLYAGTASAAQDEKQGATTDAAVVAIGAVVSSLVFGDTADDASTQKEAKPAGSMDQLKESLGEKSLESLQALTDCNHSQAFNYARQASASGNSDYALSGLWLEALTEADRKNWFEAKAYFPKIRARDSDIHSQADYDAALNKALKEIASARQEHGPASECKR